MRRRSGVRACQRRLQRGDHDLTTDPRERSNVVATQEALGREHPKTAESVNDLALLYRARESSLPRVPITRLLAQAVREAYGHLAADTSTQPIQLQEAA